MKEREGEGEGVAESSSVKLPVCVVLCLVIAWESLDEIDEKQVYGVYMEVPKSHYVMLRSHESYPLPPPLSSFKLSCFHRHVYIIRTTILLYRFHVKSRVRVCYTPATKSNQNQNQNQMCSN